MVQDVSSFHGSVNDTAGSLTVTDVDDFHIVICESFQKLRIQLAFGSHSQTYESVIERKFVFSFASFYRNECSFTSRRAVLVSWCTP